MTTAQLTGRLFCTVPEAAQILELDPRTLRRAIEADEFPAVRIAGTWRVPVAKLLSLAGVGDNATPYAPAVCDPLDGAPGGHIPD